uniref:Histamine N-methyltransferase n=1 Tax=Periophthalmus magnuspinnatus TaxID=409849 RepID=A0A3B3ZJ06_9GOBI
TQHTHYINSTHTLYTQHTHYTHSTLTIYTTHSYTQHTHTTHSLYTQHKHTHTHRTLTIYIGMHCIQPRSHLQDIYYRFQNMSPSALAMGSNIYVEMLYQLHLKHPRVLVDNKVVESSSQQLHNNRGTSFRDTCIICRFNLMYSFIFEINMLYYVKDPGATISFFHSLLKKNGKKLIISARSGSDLQSCPQLCLSKGWHASPSVPSANINTLPDARGVPYKSYKLQSHVDITECFTEGYETGKRLLDFLTKLRQEALRPIRACSVEKGGRVTANGYSDFVVIHV